MSCRSSGIVVVLAVATALLHGCAAPARVGVDDVLDDFHAAAAAADEQRYFDHLDDGGVFIGTDPDERWPKASFRAYARPYFERGVGWTYVPRVRHVEYAPDGRTAWFDEMLDHARYGACRGTGVLVRHDDTWKITQYVLTFPIPNEIAVDVVDQIRSMRADEAARE